MKINTAPATPYCNEKHARHANGYRFLGVGLMFYYHAVLKSLYIVLQKMINECKGHGV